MKKIFRLLVFVLLVSGWALAALSIHVIRSPKGFAAIPKNRLDYHDTYVDTRPWTTDDEAKHPDLMKRIEATGKADLVAHVTAPPATQPSVSNGAGTVAIEPTTPADRKGETIKVSGESLLGKALVVTPPSTQPSTMAHPKKTEPTPEPKAKGSELFPN